MVVILILLCSVIAILLTGMIYYRGKYWNYKDISNASQKQLVEQKILSKTNAKKYKNKCKEEFEKKFRIFSTKKASELEQEYVEACEAVKNELFNELKKIDTILGEHALDLATKNILTFSCSCSKDLIPCPIDFSKENTFICPKCSSKYKVIISANPVLIGRSISDEDFADLVEARLNDSKTKN